MIQNDRTPLFWASGRGHTEIVAMLLKFGADFNSCSKVSTSYFITPISAVNEYVDVYTYVNIDLCNPRHLHAQQGLLYLVCVSVCLHFFLHYMHQTGSSVIPTALPQQALENYCVDFAKRRHLVSRNWHRRGPCCVTQPINYKQCACI